MSWLVISEINRENRFRDTRKSFNKESEMADAVRDTGVNAVLGMLQCNPGNINHRCCRRGRATLHNTEMWQVP